MADAVRTPLEADDRPRRSLDQRLFLRLPRMTAGYLRLMARLPPQSRFRQTALRRGAQLTIAAYNRRDLEAVVLNCHPDFEYRPARNLVEAGLLDPSYRGLRGYRDYVANTAEVFGGEVRVEPLELIDLGDRFAVLARAPMRAQASGISLTEEWALVGTVEDGRVSRYQEYFDHREALGAVGLTT